MYNQVLSQTVWKFGWKKNGGRSCFWSSSKPAVCLSFFLSVCYASIFLVPPKGERKKKTNLESSLAHTHGLESFFMRKSRKENKSSKSLLTAPPYFLLGKIVTYRWQDWNSHSGLVLRACVLRHQGDEIIDSYMWIRNAIHQRFSARRTRPWLKKKGVPQRVPRELAIGFPFDFFYFGWDGNSVDELVCVFLSPFSFSLFGILEFLTMAALWTSRTLGRKLRNRPTSWQLTVGSWRLVDVNPRRASLGLCGFLKNGVDTQK